MTDLRLDKPTTILVTLGLTLPEVSEGDLAKIQTAATPGSTVKIAPQLREAAAMANDAEVILGFIPESLFRAAPRLRWVHAIASGVDMFLYPAMRESYPEERLSLWMGHRPSLPDSLPVIGPSRATPDVIYAFGHGHVGMTSAPMTGKVIADLVAGRPPSIDIAPFAPGRFA